MRASQGKRALTLGKFIMAIYDAPDKRRAREIVCLAVNSGLVEFRGRRRFMFSRQSLN
jgi:hypothetical protein